MLMKLTAVHEKMQTYLMLLEGLTKQNLTAWYKNSAMKVYIQNVVHQKVHF